MTMDWIETGFLVFFWSLLVLLWVGIAILILFALEEFV